MNELCATKDNLEQCKETETWLIDGFEEYLGGLADFRASAEAWF